PHEGGLRTGCPEHEHHVRDEGGFRIGRARMSGVKDGATGGPNHPIVVAPTESRFWSLPDGVRLAGEPGEAAGVTYPEGFAGSGVAVGLKHSRRPDMGVLAVVPPWREGATSAAV